MHLWICIFFFYNTKGMQHMIWFVWIVLGSIIIICFFFWKNNSDVEVGVWFTCGKFLWIGKEYWLFPFLTVLVVKAVDSLHSEFRAVDNLVVCNTNRVLKAFQNARVGSHVSIPLDLYNLYANVHLIWCSMLKGSRLINLLTVLIVIGRDVL